jgi:nucleoid-associated protein YgaU
MNLSQTFKKYFKSSEEVVSMFLGLVIVVVVVGMIFNFIQRKKGNINIPGSTDINITQNDIKDIDNKSNEISEANSYVVVIGDSLWKIAKSKYNDGNVWKEIAKANNLKNPSDLEVGQKLVLPSIEKKEVIVASTKTNTIAAGEYKVVRNDSLWKIAVRAYGDGYQWVKIWQENKSKFYDPNKLEIGMMLTIPSLK